MKSKYNTITSLDQKIKNKFHEYFSRKSKTQKGIIKIIKELPDEKLKDIYHLIVHWIDLTEVNKTSRRNTYYRQELALHKFYELRPEFKKRYKPKMSIDELKRLDNENLKLDKEANPDFKKTQEKDLIGSIDENSDLIKTFIGGIAVLIIIVGLIMQFFEESKCESVTYYEYGVKKTGKVCNGAVKETLRNNIEATKKLRNS